jgi:CRISPR system Cascade subunit CasD
MAAWGEVAVGELRDSAPHPTRSALLGLLAAARGIRREQEAESERLARSLRFAVRLESLGVPLADYHTVQVAPRRRGQVVATRADQLRGARDDLQTILSRREYRCDALYVVATWQEAPDAAWTLDALAAALEQPVFPLYLGRKSCPPALPLTPRLVDAGSAAEAFGRVALPPLPRAFARLLDRPRDGGVVWEGLLHLGDIAADRTHLRRDDPISTTRRTFRVRREHRAPFAGRVSSMENGDDVPEPDQPGK